MMCKRPSRAARGSAAGADALFRLAFEASSDLMSLIRVTSRGLFHVERMNWEGERAIISSMNDVTERRRAIGVIRRLTESLEQKVRERTTEFGVFERLHSEAEFESAGIGLAHAARIVARHGGRIWCDAMPEQGATFFFTLPA